MLNWGDALRTIGTIVAALIAGRQQLKGKADQSRVDELERGQSRLTRLLDRMIFATEQHIQLQFYSLDDHNRITHELPENYRPPFQRWNQDQRRLILDYADQVGRVKAGDADANTFTSATAND